MSELRDELQQMTADVALEMAMEMGEQFIYYHQGTPISVYGIPGEEQVNADDTENIVGQAINKSFSIPMQTSFPPGNDPQKIRKGDYVLFQNTKWYVEGGSRGSLQSMFIIRCANKQEHYIK